MALYRRLREYASILGAAFLVSSTALAQGAMPGAAASDTIRLATLTVDGKAAASGDILRTTRLFPNWNLNCEVLLSEGRHLCAVETRSVDASGRLLLAWSIALGADGAPVMVLKATSDVDAKQGIGMTIGAFTTTFAIKPENCTPTECRTIAAFDQTLRTLASSEKKVSFTLVRAGTPFRVDAPLQGLSEALETARRDPIGLLAVQRRAEAMLTAKSKHAVGGSASHSMKYTAR